MTRKTQIPRIRTSRPYYIVHTYDRIINNDSLDRYIHRKSLSGKFNLNVFIESFCKHSHVFNRFMLKASTSELMAPAVVTNSDYIIHREIAQSTNS